MLEDFKKFALRGNVVDLAVGVIIGGAFGKIVSSLVANIIMPLIGILIGGINFSHLKLILKPAHGDVAEVAILYGTFIQSVVDFLIIAFALFFVVKIITSLHKKEETKPVAPVAPDPKVVLLEEIRDLLKEEK